MSGNASTLRGGGGSGRPHPASDETNVAGHDPVRETRVGYSLVKVVCREDQLVTLMGLVREYTTDDELYDTLARARP